MHPHTRSTKAALALCMVILLVLLLAPLPYAGYQILKFILSIGLFYSACFFLRPRKRLIFTRARKQTEFVNIHPTTLSMSGELRDWTAKRASTPLSMENSKMLVFLNAASHIQGTEWLLPPVSLRLYITMTAAAFVMSPITGIGLSKPGWMIFDALIFALLTSAWFVIRNENFGSRPPFSFTSHKGGEPVYPFIQFDGLMRHLRIFWPVHLGLIAAIVALGRSTENAGIENTVDAIGDAIGVTTAGLQVALFAAMFTFLLVLLSVSLARRGIDNDCKALIATPGEVIIAVFAFVILAMGFSGFFDFVSK